ncbi:MAG: thiamine-phosphate kinase [Bacteroidota bacterium]
MSEDKKKLTGIAELGEFRLIEHLTSANIIKNESTVFGTGDDAAVLDSGGKKLVVTTDLLVEGIHFDLIYTPLKHLGYKSVVVNLSDIYAMNAVPQQITLSIALSGKFSVEALDEFYSGVYLACEKYGIDLVGGDTSSSLTGLMISITAIGYAKEDEIVYRSGAVENDILCVSGDLGAAYLGLQLLEREKKVFNVNPGMQPDFSGNDYILQRQLKPEARKDIIEALQKAGVQPTAMIDISDGLSSELLHICNRSGKGCRVYEDKIPIHPEAKRMAAEFGLDPSIPALNGGEDYELLFTVSISEYEKVKDISGITVIGHITSEKEGKNLITRDGTAVELMAQGWNALKSE